MFGLSNGGFSNESDVSFEFGYQSWVSFVKVARENFKRIKI